MAPVSTAKSTARQIVIKRFDCSIIAVHSNSNCQVFMQSVGQKLRHAREAQARTLNQVNSTTRISIQLLEAIEADDLICMSSAFLYKSFVKQFADDVQIDYQEIAADVQAMADRIPAPLMPGQGPIQPPKIAALQIGRRRSTRLTYAVTSFAIALVACSGIYAFWQNSAMHVPDALHTLWPTSENSEPAAVPDLSASNQPAPDKSAKGFTLQLSATEPAWLSIIADGKPSFSGILERAQTKILRGHRTARIQTRNAGAVKAVFNGKPLGALGARGQVRTVLFTKNNYEVIENPPSVSFSSFTQTAELRLPSDLVILPTF
jgi:cytoskeleton protein RodZ